MTPCIYCQSLMTKIPWRLSLICTQERQQQHQQQPSSSSSSSRSSQLKRYLSQGIQCEQYLWLIFIKFHLFANLCLLFQFLLVFKFEEKVRTSESIFGFAEFFFISKRWLEFVTMTLSYFLLNNSFFFFFAVKWRYFMWVSQKWRKNMTMPANKRHNDLNSNA